MSQTSKKRKADAPPAKADESESDSDDFEEGDEMTFERVDGPGAKDDSSKKQKKGGGSSSASKEDEEEEEIFVDFEFFDPRPTDFHTLKMLLKNYTDDVENFNTSELADLIGGQVTVGTMIKNGDGGDEQPLAFISCINMHHHKDLKCIKQIKKFLIKNCRGDEDKKTLNGLLNDPEKPLGLIIQNRLMNLPFNLVPPLHQSLQDDIEWATKNEEEHLRNDFKFENYILIARCFSPSATAMQGLQKKKKKKKKQGKSGGKLKQGGAAGEGALFYRFEEAHYQKEAFLSYSFNAKKPKNAEANRIPQSRVVLLIHRSKMGKILEGINSEELG